MKKALFILGGVAMFAFASCDNKSDCDCKATIDGDNLNDVVVGSVTEFDGDCDQVKLSDLTLGSNWTNITELGEKIELRCEEK